MEPDVLFVRKDRLDILSDRGAEAAPDLVAEILSPSTAVRDRGIKLERYRHFGVPEYWIVDPDARAIDVRRLAKVASEPEVFAAEDMLHWRPGPPRPLWSSWWVRYWNQSVAKPCSVSPQRQ